MQIIKSTADRLTYNLSRLDCDKNGAVIMQQKGNLLFFEIYQIKTPAALILKQEALSLGAEVALPKSAIMGNTQYLDAVLIVSERLLPILCSKLYTQPFGLKKMADALQEHELAFTSRIPKLMGVLNLTPDSFYEQSRFMGHRALQRVFEMIQEGADIIDIGAASSRPGSDWVSEEEEISRLKIFFEDVKRHNIHKLVTLSIDTYSSKVAALAIESGFHIVNDITGFMNQEMIEVVSQNRCGVVLMHMLGNPKDMQNNPHYDNVVLEVDSFFKRQIDTLKQKNVENIILDIGIGFGKTLRHNLELIAYLGHFKHYSLPLLVGASRKSLIHALVPSDVKDRLAGTIALHIQAASRGADIIRCHDIKEHKQAFIVDNAFNILEDM